MSFVFILIPNEAIATKLCYNLTACGLFYHGTSFTTEVNPWLAKRSLKNNGRLANRGLASLVKEATRVEYEM